MTKSLLVLFLVFFFAFPLFAQQVDTAWVRRYNGPANSDDYAFAIAVDDSGNAYVTGYSVSETWPNVNYDYATIKYDSQGNQLWVQRCNGPGNDYDAAFAIAIDGYGNVYVTGVSVGSGTSGDYATIKYYPDGDTAWVRRYNGPGNLSDYACAIATDSFNNIYVTGYSMSSGTWPFNYDYATIKYDLDGNEIWVRRYDGPGNTDDLAYAITTDGYGNVYVTGSSGGDYATIKYDSSGNELWVRTKDGTGSHDNAYSIAVDVYDNVYVTGYNSGDYSDYVTVKYDSSGKEIWAKSYNGPGIGRDEAHAIGVDDSGNAYVTGFSIGSGTDYDYATIKYDSSGNEVWVRRYNGPGNSLDGGSAMAIDISNNIYVTGHSVGSGGDRDYATIGYDPSGNERWVKRYNGPGNSFDGAYDIAVDGSGNVYVTGVSSSISNGDYATIKYWQNYTPDFFSLISPSDSVIIPYVVFFDWGTAIDPDPWDTVRYDLYISISSSFHPDSTVILNGLLVNEYTDTLEWGRYYWKVRAYDKRSEVWSNQIWTFFSGILGDANSDKKVTVSDVIYLINFLFKSGPAPNPYQAGDVNCDSYVTVSDVIYLINYLFKGGPAPCS
jgi:hypothetical protein